MSLLPSASRRRFLAGAGLGSALFVLGPVALARGAGGDAPGISLFTRQRRLALTAALDVELRDFGREAYLLGAAGERRLLPGDQSQGSIDYRARFVAATSHRGRVCLLDRGRRRIDRFHPDGRFDASLDLAADVYEPVALYSDGESLWLADTGSHEVLRMDGKGVIRQRWGGAPHRGDSLNGPAALFADAAGDIYVLEKGHGRISVWSRDGKWLRPFAGSGPGPALSGLALVPGTGQVLTLDAWRGAVQVYDRTGRLAGEVALGKGQSPGLATLTQAPGKGIYLSV